MSLSVADAVTHALPETGDAASQIDLRDLQHELDAVAAEALEARSEGVSLSEAVNSSRFGALSQFHRDLRDALFVEIPRDLERWVGQLRDAPRTSGMDLGAALASVARREADEGPANAELQRALAEVLLFESVRLRLIAATYQNDEFDRLGGEEADLDEIAWEEVATLLENPAIEAGDVRPLEVMYAAASMSLAHEAATRASELRQSGSEHRERLEMRARLKAALRELRLTESVLLENALSSLLGTERRELRDLQAERPIALEGLSRQAMDQRVSRGRRALTQSSQAWPRRRRPALFDLLGRDDESA